MTLYPTCGEATICLVTPHVEPPERSEVDDGALDPEGNWDRANRRAKVRSRRYIVHNRLRFMWVLTYPQPGKHGPEGRAEVMAAVARLCRRLRAELGALPYWFSPELHPGGHGWHCNLFLPRYVPHHLVERWWGEGYVWVKDWTRDSRVEGQEFLSRLRQGATYGAKYAAKDWAPESIGPRAHRYERAEDFDPPTVVAEARTVLDGVALAADYLGPLVSTWLSSTEEDWPGPPCAVVVARYAAVSQRRSGHTV